MGEWLTKAWDFIVEHWGAWTVSIVGYAVYHFFSDFFKNLWKTRKEKWQNFKKKYNVQIKKFKRWWNNHINIFMLINKVKYYEKQLKYLNDTLFQLVKIITLDDIMKLHEKDKLHQYDIECLWIDENGNIKPAITYKGKTYIRPRIYDLLTVALSGAHDYETEINNAHSMTCFNDELYEISVNDMLSSPAENINAQHMLRTYEEHKKLLAE